MNKISVIQLSSLNHSQPLQQVVTGQGKSDYFNSTREPQKKFLLDSSTNCLRFTSENWADSGSLEIITVCLCVILPVGEILLCFPSTEQGHCIGKGKWGVLLSQLENNSISHSFKGKVLEKGQFKPVEWTHPQKHCSNLISYSKYIQYS